MLDPESPDVQLAVFGREVEIFLEGDIGTYIKQCVQRDIEAAQEGFLTVDPEDHKAIRALQFKASVAMAVWGWLQEAIQSGNSAQALIRETQ